MYQQMCEVDSTFLDDQTNRRIYEWMEQRMVHRL